MKLSTESLTSSGGITTTTLLHRTRSTTITTKATRILATSIIISAIGTLDIATATSAVPMGTTRRLATKRTSIIKIKWDRTEDAIITTMTTITRTLQASSLDAAAAVGSARSTRATLTMRSIFRPVRHLILIIKQWAVLSRGLAFSTLTPTLTSRVTADY